MKTVSINLYEFQELGDDAKMKALSSLRDINVDVPEWYDCTIEDIKHLAGLFGVDVDKILFSGFYSQGDGASFTGRYQYKKEGTRALKAAAPLDTELHGVARSLQDIQSRHFYRLKTTITQRGLYCHELTMFFDTAGMNGNPDDVDDLPELEEALRDLARYCHRRLKKEYEHLTSDGQVIEAIETLGLLFGVKGDQWDGRYEEQRNNNG